MKNYLLTPLLVAVFSFLYAGQSVSAESKDNASLPKVLLIGDSISIGYTKPVASALQDVAIVKHAGTNCGPTSRGVKYLDQWLAKDDWDVVHFNFGLHDIKYMTPDGKTARSATDKGASRQIDPATYEANLRNIVEKLKQTDAKLIWCTTTPVPEGARARLPKDAPMYNAIAAKVMQDSGIATNDLYEFALPKLSEIQRPKDVHYTKEGYAVLASKIADSIKQMIGSNDKITTNQLDTTEFIPANDEERITHHGRWAIGGGPVDGSARNRYCWPFYLRSWEKGNSIDVAFEGTGIAVIFHTPRMRAYGYAEKDGHMRANVQGSEPIDIIPHESPLEVVVADNLTDGKHKMTLVDLNQSGTIAGFRVFKQPVGHAAGTIDADNVGYLFDVRINIFRGEKLVRTTLHRNWLNKKFAVTGLITGDDYRFEVEAVGWSTWTSEPVKIEAGQHTELGDIFLHQHPATARGQIETPAIGYPAVATAEQTITVETSLPEDAPKPDNVRLTRNIEGSSVSREANFLDDHFTVPDDMPPGVYDLQLLSGGNVITTSPRSVVIRETHSTGKLTILTWGHTDTWGQHQAEFERTLFDIANVIGPDLVLVSNAVNPANISGSAANLRAPYLINFGNHRLRGHEKWFGPQVGMIDVGPNITVFNFGWKWKEDLTGLKALMAQRKQTPCRILNAFEVDVPISLLQENDIRLFHDAHGWLKPRVLILPDTQTQRVGKVSASSFRIVKFEDYRVTSVSEALEIDRIKDQTIVQVPPAPLRVEQEQIEEDAWQAWVINDLPTAIDAARVVFVVPNGDYEIEGAELVSTVASDDGKWVEVIARLPIDTGEKKSVLLQVK